MDLGALQELFIGSIVNKYKYKIKVEIPNEVTSVGE